MSNKSNGTRSTRVTDDLVKRVYQHKNLNIEGFANGYDCELLVYYPKFGS